MIGNVELNTKVNTNYIVSSCWRCVNLFSNRNMNSAIVQQKLYGTMDTDKMKCKLLHEWAEQNNNIIASAFRCWWRHLRACVNAHG